MTRGCRARALCWRFGRFRFAPRDAVPHVRRTGGNARDLAREKNAKKQAGKGTPGAGAQRRRACGARSILHTQRAALAGPKNMKEREELAEMMREKQRCGGARSDGGTCWCRRARARADKPRHARPQRRRRRARRRRRRAARSRRDARTQRTIESSHHYYGVCVRARTSEYVHISSFGFFIMNLQRARMSRTAGNEAHRRMHAPAAERLATILLQLVGERPNGVGLHAHARTHMHHCTSARLAPTHTHQDDVDKVCMLQRVGARDAARPRAAAHVSGAANVRARRPHRCSG